MVNSFTVNIAIVSGIVVVAVTCKRTFIFGCGNFCSYKTGITISVFTKNTAGISGCGGNGCTVVTASGNFGFRQFNTATDNTANLICTADTAAVYRAESDVCFIIVVTCITDNTADIISGTDDCAVIHMAVADNFTVISTAGNTANITCTAYNTSSQLTVFNDRFYSGRIQTHCAYKCTKATCCACKI